MALRTLSVAASMVAAVSSAGIKKQRLELDHPSSTPAKECPLFPDVIGVILSFLAPFEWNDLFCVNRMFHASKPFTISNLKLLRPHFEYSSNLDISKVLKQVIQQPGWKGVIANERDYLIFDHPSEEEIKGAMVPYSGKVRITGLQRDVETVLRNYDQTNCADHFIHWTFENGLCLHVKNIHNGKDITVDEWMGMQGRKVLVNEEQLLCVDSGYLSVHQLDWQNQKSSLIFREFKLPISENGLICDHSGNVFSLIQDENGLNAIQKYNWKIGGETILFGSVCESDTFLGLSTDQQWIFSGGFKKKANNKVESIDGKKRLLCAQFDPALAGFHCSPDSRYLALQREHMSLLLNLFSGLVTLINHERHCYFDSWLNNHLFLMKKYSFPTIKLIVRSLLNPCVDLDLGSDCTPDFTKLKVGSIVNVRDFLYHWTNIGHDMFYIQSAKMMIQVEWL